MFGPAIPRAEITFMNVASFRGCPRGGEEAMPDVHAAGSTLLMIYFGFRRGLTVDKRVAGESKYK